MSGFSSMGMVAAFLGTFIYVVLRSLDRVRKGTPLKNRALVSVPNNFVYPSGVRRGGWLTNQFGSQRNNSPLSCNVGGSEILGFSQFMRSDLS